MTIATTVDIKTTKTLVCDVMDVHPDKVRLLDSVFRDYGGKKSFHGFIATIKCFEDNSKIWEALEEAGNARVLVVDGGGSLGQPCLGETLLGKHLKMAGQAF